MLPHLGFSSILLGALTVYHDTYFVEGNSKIVLVFLFLDHPAISKL
jgi:hypothetical protein